MDVVRVPTKHIYSFFKMAEDDVEAVELGGKRIPTTSEDSDPKFLKEGDISPMLFNVWVLDINNINITDHSFSAYLEVVIKWKITEKEYMDYLTYTKSNTTPDWRPIVDPKVQVLNVRSIEHYEPYTWVDGSIYHVMECSDWGLENEKAVICETMTHILVTFTESMELEAFPFDIQDLTMDIQVQPRGPGGWNDIGPVMEDSRMYVFEQAFSTQEYELLKTDTSRGGWDRRYRMNFKVKRNWINYVFRVLFVIALVQLASLAIFCFGEDSAADRFGYLSALLLTAVAFLFIVKEELPQLKSATFLDYYILTSFVFVFGLMVTTYVQVKLEKLEEDDTYAIVCFVVWCIMQLAFVFSAYRHINGEKRKLDEFPAVDMSSVQNLHRPQWTWRAKEWKDHKMQYEKIIKAD